ncbi:archaemetzincin-2 isoform X2 [Homo sapiens]|uniref:archaemetzincin-2 isoform 3 n=1 Tax=Homo sapiens TaxID=9606 RepID=UPI0000EE5C89|nr:archaemetzincin-2 isoform 3 [Homo sapiens]NP_001333411.1 archaemetzincin-2 isoform 3 [Homo sapiens]NP_001333412.1 archaemetzincin-2 isoform 3 [Homo sapiens]NP_001333413.1 archaemetzincin-2 isoform 3 [Homo sapiens]XP_047292167.1 archaemetzincin-2 isoform X2 [Homo sapiens]XP_054172346.1 archaemetzincin-2 isoform X2 [Homo sapiens]EAW89047.1 archaemetzincins-2, isoform CRA_a [Homo sapiens]|eukprot:NP_001333410.1 archaemetzincin-2 isoform 3 [Homo sapiens]
MKPSSQPVISLDPLPCILHQIGSPPTLRLPKTLNSSSVILTERHPLQTNAAFIYSPLVNTGSLGNTRIISEEYIKWLTGYCKAYFYGLRVKLLEPVPVSVTRCSFRVNENTHNLQIHAGDILKFLKKKKPEDAFCVVGITMIDLYPRDSWNFVFGQASLTDGVGIFSFARYGSDFYSMHYKGKVKKLKKTSSSDYSIFDNYYIPEITSVLLLRSCKTLTHEIGHIFGLRHCQWLACLMQGSNHLEEADRRPLNLCPICLHKLQCAVGFSIVERYKALVRWIDDESSDTPGATPEHSHEDNGNLPKPVEAFKEWKEWIIKCLAVLQK